MKTFRLLTALFASALIFSACGASAQTQQTTSQVCPGTPEKVTPMPTYVLVDCGGGVIHTLNVAQGPGGQVYSNGQDALNDPFFWMWAFGPHYSSFGFYHTYVSSPMYHSYAYSHPYSPSRYSVSHNYNTTIVNHNYYGGGIVGIIVLLLVLHLLGLF